MNYRFTGKELDTNTGLLYYGARYYDPKISVWQSPDPILEEYLNFERNGGVSNGLNLNSYAYSYQNPIRFYDPNGKIAIVDDIAVALIVSFVLAGATTVAIKETVDAINKKKSSSKNNNNKKPDNDPGPQNIPVPNPENDHDDDNKKSVMNIHLHDVQSKEHDDILR